MASRPPFFAKWGEARVKTRRLNEELDLLRFNQGVILSKLDLSNASPRLADHEFKVFSQWGEDGILQFLTRVVPIAQRTFIEFGVEDFSESNCRFLMQKDNWRGFVIDGSADNVKSIRRAPYFWRHELNAKQAFITRENIQSLLAESGFDADLGVLSIDIDGNDYHVWQAIEAFHPRIVVCEYNSVFGPDDTITVPYQADFQRSAAHHSNLYWGASIAALAHLASAKGYSLVGGNIAGNNAFFVRNDLVNGNLAVCTPAEAHEISRYRESRDAEGKANWLSGDARRRAIAGLPVLNVVTGDTRTLD
jgi:hypothetical protein